MKKCLMVLLSLCAVGSAFGYDFRINNKASNSIKVSIKYGGPGVCAPDEINVKGGRTRKVKTGACCPLSVNVRKTSGPQTDKQYTFRPKATGYGLSCTSNEMTVYENSDGTLTLERD